jgi:hypothetical protein
VRGRAEHAHPFSQTLANERVDKVWPSTRLVDTPPSRIASGRRSVLHVTMRASARVLRETAMELVLTVGVPFGKAPDDSGIPFHPPRRFEPSSSGIRIRQYRVNCGLISVRRSVASMDD